MNADEKAFCEEFGALLREFRLDAGISQADVSKKCGYSSPQFISNLERGLTWPPMNVLAKMSDLYGIKKSVLLDNLMNYRKKVWSLQLGIGTKSKISRK